MEVPKAYVALLAVAVLLSVMSVAYSYSLMSEVRGLLSRQADVLSSVQADVSELRSGVSLLSAEFKTLRDLVGGLSVKYEELSGRLKGVKYPFMVADSVGRTVVIKYEPVRLISVGPALTEVLFALGVGDRVVGVDRFSNYPPVLSDLIGNGSVKVVGDAFSLNVELVASLRPDVIFIAYSTQLERYIKTLSDLGFTVYVVRVDDVSDVYNAVLALGFVVNRVDEALKLVDSSMSEMVATYMAVCEYLNRTGAGRLSVYWEVFPDYWTLGGNAFQSSVVEYAGGVNVFANTSMTWFTASPESVISLNPSVIIISYNYGAFGSYQDLVSRIASRPGWESVRAVRDGRVYVVGGVAEDVLSRPGPRLALAVKVLARILYPGAFNITQVPVFVGDDVIAGWGLLKDGLTGS
ncbi:MAG: ABC transporter substrate-binding protein [Zestosphaera sp.]